MLLPRTSLWGFMNCPTCGLLNLPAATFCIHCKSPMEFTPRPSTPASGNVIELNRLKAPAASSGGAQAQRAPAQSDWREQLNLKLERLKEKNSDTAPGASVLDEDFRQREFVRPGPAGSETTPEVSAHRGYHPLAEKALEKIDRAKAGSTESILEIPADLSTAVPALWNPRSQTGGDVLLEEVRRLNGSKSILVNQRCHSKRPKVRSSRPKMIEFRAVCRPQLLPRGSELG